MKITIQDKLLYPEILWKRPVHLYNKRAGRILVVGGSGNNTRKSIFCSEASFRSGTGFLTLGFPEGLSYIYRDLLPKAMELPLPETINYTLSKESEKQIADYTRSVDLVIIGPGISKNAETLALVWQLLFKIRKHVILCDDALTAFILGLKVLGKESGEEGVGRYLSTRKSPTILNLNTGDVLKILKIIKYKTRTKKKIDNKYVINNLKKISSFLASFLDMFIVINGGGSIIISEPEDRVAITNCSANKIYVSILSGIMGALVSQNQKKIFEALSTSAYLYRKSHEIADRKTGKREMMPSDIIRYLPKAILESEEEM